MTLVFTGLLSLLALMRMPLFIVIAAAACYGFYVQDVNLSVVGLEIYRITDTPLLLALPLFAFSGYLLSETRAPERLLSLTRAFFGWVPAGLPLVAFLTSAFFTAITGASGVTIVAVGALLYPALRQSGYTKDFSLGLVTSAGSLGLLLVPSMPLILYGIVVQQMDLPIQLELTDLFIAGIGPLLLMIAMLSVWSLWATRHQREATVPFSPRRVGAALWQARWELPLPVILLGGIYGGIVTLSEAAAMTAIYVLVIQVFLYRELPLRQLPRVVLNTCVMVGEILLILAVALAFTNVLINADIPTWLFEQVRGAIENRYVFLMLLNGLLLLLGALLDIFSATIIMVPLIVPVALSYGIDPVHLGIIFLANMQLGYFTPPVGMNLFIAGIRFKEPMTDIYRATWPFFLVLLAAVLLITYVPALSLFLLK
ncbi:MAG: TRAP transporter large permease subunit [Pseudomonadota bacterium]